MGRAGRPTVAIELSDDERDTLRRWARRHKSSQALTLRSRIVLACAEGETNTAIAAELGCNKVTVAKWRHRFAADRLEGLTDTPRPGAARTIGDDVVEDRSARPGQRPAASPRGHQLWLQQKGVMVPAGLMPEGGPRQVLLEGDAASATAAGIAIEPPSGSPAPTTKPIALFDFAEAV